jgi:Glycosyl transferases group 1
MRRVVYLSWPAHEIAGGIKMAFRHVEALCASGATAVIATPDNERPRWFESSAPVVPIETLTEQDVLVFPENHNGLLEQFSNRANLKVVFCQNWTMIHRGLGNRREYADFGVNTLITVGQFTAAVLRRRFPTTRLFIVPNYVDRRRFACPTEKHMAIAFMPRKRPAEVDSIRDLFAAENPDLRQWPWVKIDGQPEERVAKMLGHSAVYLSLCRLEAFPLTLLEAFSCGCITAGYTGLGGREVATARNGFWSAEDDPLDAVTQLTRAVRLVVEQGPRYQEMLEETIATAGIFSPQRFTGCLVRCWRTLAPDAFAAAGSLS